jgi:hypothetical protein
MRMKKITKEDIRQLEIAVDEMQLMLRESKIKKTSRAAVPNMRKHDGLDNSSPYAPWRFGIALAGAPEFKMDKLGPTGQKLVTVAYTDADADIIKATEKFMGAKGSNVTTAGSKELSDIHRASPVATIKRNKYGI